MELVNHRQLPDGTCICHSDHRVAEVRQAARAPICPECRSGKHGNCDGEALNEATDEIVACTCPPAFHPKGTRP